MFRKKSEIWIKTHTTHPDSRKSTSYSETLATSVLSSNEIQLKIVANSRMNQQYDQEHNFFRCHGLYAWEDYADVNMSMNACVVEIDKLYKL